MNLYYVTDEYIDYLRSFDQRIYDNKGKTRPYVGVLFSISSYNYYACLSSPKPKHKSMRNTKDFRKINNGVWGAINFNYMIPVPQSELSVIDIGNIQDVKYRRLLQNQYNFIKNDWSNIEQTAFSLYQLCNNDDKKLTKHDITVKNRCCDFKLLEKKCKEYKPRQVGTVSSYS